MHQTSLNLFGGVSVRILILGGDLAAVYAVHWIRKVDPISKITLICDTEFPGFIRSLLPYIALGEVEPFLSIAFPKAFVEKIERVELVRVKKLGEISLSEGVLQAGDKEYVLESSDKVLISTGVEALGVPKKFAERIGEIYPLEKIEEALLLAERVQELGERTRIGVLGGFYGLDIAYKLAVLGHDVELFFDEKRSLYEVLDSDMIGLIRKILPSNLLFKEMEWDKAADNDIIIARGYAKPIIPRMEGIVVGEQGGVLVDEYMKAFRNAFAAGSVVECVEKSTGISFSHLSDNLSIAQGIIAALNIEGFNYQVKRFFPLYEALLGEKLVFSAGFSSEILAKHGKKVVTARHHFYTGDVASRGEGNDVYVKVIADRVTRTIYGVQVICGKEYAHGLYQILAFLANNLLIDDVVLTPPLYFPFTTRLIDPFKATCQGIWRKLLKK